MATTSTPHSGEPQKQIMIWPKLREHMIKILLLAAMSTAAMATYVELRTREYTAYAEVLIEQNERDFRHLVEGISDNAAPLRPEELEIELKRIASALTLQEVIEELNLTFEEHSPFSFRAWARAQFSTKMEGAESSAGRRALAHQLAAFRENLVVKRDPLASVILIGYRAPDPETSADVANALARTYLRNRTSGQRQGMKKAVDDLERIADQMSASILAAEQETEQYRAEADLYAIDGVLPIEQHYNRLSRELTEAALDLTNARARMLEAETGQPENVSLEGQEEPQALSLIDKLRAENTETGQRAAVLDSSLNSYPAAISRDDVDVNGASQAEGDRLVEQRRLKVNAAETRYRELEKQAQKTRAELSDSWDSRLRLRELERHVAHLRQSYPAMQERLQRAREREQLLIDDARIIGPATIPTQPSNISGLLLVGMTLMGSCVAGMGWALLSETRRHGFHDAFEVETELGQPVLGMLPKVHGIAPIDADPETSSYQRQWSLEAYGFLEGVRSILNTILPNHRGDGPAIGKVVLITSCFPDEGKTTLALSLTRQAALGGAKSVLVEGDMRKMGLVTKLSTVAPDKGLVDLLRGTIDQIDDALVSEPESDADLLLAAGPHEDAFALSRSPRMKIVLDELKSRYDLIIIDCPPVLGVSDTRAMSDLADEILFVLRWQETHRVAAKSAIRELEREKLPMAGVVVTQIDLAKHLKSNTTDKFRYEDSYEAYANVTLREGTVKKESA